MYITIRSTPYGKSVTRHVRRLALTSNITVLMMSFSYKCKASFVSYQIGGTEFFAKNFTFFYISLLSLLVFCTLSSALGGRFNLGFQVGKSHLRGSPPHNCRIACRTQFNQFPRVQRSRGSLELVFICSI